MGNELEKQPFFFEILPVLERKGQAPNPLKNILLVLHSPGFAGFERGLRFCEGILWASHPPFLSSHPPIFCRVALLFFVELPSYFL